MQPNRAQATRRGVAGEAGPGMENGKVSEGDHISNQGAASANVLSQWTTLAAILDGLDDGVIVTDADGVCLLANTKARELLQTEGEEQNVLKWEESFAVYRADGTTEMQPGELPLAQALCGKACDPLDVVLQHRRSGKRLTLNVKARPLNWHDARAGGLVVFREVTELRQHEATLQEQAKDLAGTLFLLHSRNREIGTFHHTLAHELKTPLTSVREFVSIVLDGLAGPVNVAQAEYLKLAEHSCDDMAQQINDLLDSSRLETGKLEVKPVAADAGRVVEMTAALFKPSMEARGIRLRTDVKANLPQALIDERRITQVLTNLLSNSRKYTPDNGEVVIEVAECPGDNERIVVSVSNSGPPIEPHHLPRIFERLYQVRRSDATERGGLGLGLYLCKQIIRAHGGEIYAENIGERGVRFSLTLLKAKEGARAMPARRTLVDVMLELFEKPQTETGNVEDSRS
jgi:two-component system phosphate regulon sensor histidine kinase PhoR